MNLRECYDQIKRLTAEVDSFEIVEEVSRIRESWRPGKVRVVLLAESHARTTREDFASRWRITNTEYQGSYVRFVYCLANGEPTLVPKVRRNNGTWQYWKILFSCLHRVSENKDFLPILHSTPLEQRISNKISLLSDLRKAGVWLVDSSIVSVNHLREPKALRTRRKILLESWKYAGSLLESLRPTLKHIIVIGSSIEETLRKEITSLEIDHTTLPQPQAHLPAPGYFPFYKTYYEKCSESET